MIIYLIISFKQTWLVIYGAKPCRVGRDRQIRIQQPSSSEYLAHAISRSWLPKIGMVWAVFASLQVGWPFGQPQPSSPPQKLFWWVGGTCIHGHMWAVPLVRNMEELSMILLPLVNQMMNHPGKQEVWGFFQIIHSNCPQCTVWPKSYNPISDGDYGNGSPSFCRSGWWPNHP